ncbi:bifunctional adenosylcobinamide kinase/adenosylcobinamide-phosphate guanylyltransferase [Planococcus salinus]|uniref:Uncharacterized protein n=1 Tax=Planococcus salinus TaxID=1848460 RepID=A0A3M8P8S2_9BACL|nr:bifunctional adenosylcobinamide kinase/adenosylcobinamide-phosphate guanylyltransferase [Planococcus salinus]RNF40048.1 hypothetical protein EEX84_05265 [Planococcus salinus]
MHIVFGGAFNGKRQYVKEMLSSKETVWCEGKLPDAADQSVVIAGLEQWVKMQLERQMDEETIQQLVKKTVQSKKGQQQIWILTDMNRGIVPVDAIERKLRDVIGRIYQDLFKEAELVTRIWYGIPQLIKGADENEHLYQNRR